MSNPPTSVSAVPGNKAARRSSIPKEHKDLLSFIMITDNDGALSKQYQSGLSTKAQRSSFWAEVSRKFNNGTKGNYTVEQVRKLYHGITKKLTSEHDKEADARQRHNQVFNAYKKMCAVTGGGAGPTGPLEDADPDMVEGVEGIGGVLMDPVRRSFNQITLKKNTCKAPKKTTSKVERKTKVQKKINFIDESDNSSVDDMEESQFGIVPRSDNRADVKLCEEDEENQHMYFNETIYIEDVLTSVINEEVIDGNVVLTPPPASPCVSGNDRMEESLNSADTADNAVFNPAPALSHVVLQQCNGKVEKKRGKVNDGDEAKKNIRAYYRQLSRNHREESSMKVKEHKEEMRMKAEEMSMRAERHDMAKKEHLARMDILHQLKMRASITVEASVGAAGVVEITDVAGNELVFPTAL